MLSAERWIIARLRHRHFTSLAEANAAIAECVSVLNARPFKKLDGSRKSLFELLDRPALRPLPPARYEFATWKKAKVNIDYHIEAEGTTTTTRCLTSSSESSSRCEAPLERSRCSTAPSASPRTFEASCATSTRPIRRTCPSRTGAMRNGPRAAAETFASGGVSQADIGRKLGVSHQTVSDWHATWIRGGHGGAAGCGSGRPATEADRRTARQGGGRAREGLEGERLRHRAVDSRPGGRSDRGGHGCQISPWARLADPSRAAQLDAPEGGTPGDRARDDEAIEQWAKVAEGKRKWGAGAR